MKPRNENGEEIYQQHVDAQPRNVSLVLPALSMEESHAEQVIIALRANIIADVSAATVSVASEPSKDVQAHGSVLRAVLGDILKVSAHNEWYAICLFLLLMCESMLRHEYDLVTMRPGRMYGVAACTVAGCRLPSWYVHTGACEQLNCTASPCTMYYVRAGVNSELQSCAASGAG